VRLAQSLLVARVEFILVDGFGVDGEEEGGADAHFAFEPHASAHQFAETHADDKAEAGATVSALSRGVHLREGMEELLVSFNGDAAACITNREEDGGTLVKPRTELQRTERGRGVYRRGDG